MNSTIRASGARSPSRDAVTPRIGANTKNISYPDLRIFSERVSSDSSRSGPTTSTTTRVEDLLAQLKVENQIKRGAENMLQVLDEQKGQPGKDQLQKQVEARQQQVESQLDAANAKILLLKSQLQDLGVARTFFFAFAILCCFNNFLGSSLESDRTSFVTDKLSSNILASIENVEELDGKEEFSLFLYSFLIVFRTSLGKF